MVVIKFIVVLLVYTNVARLQGLDLLVNKCPTTPPRGTTLTLTRRTHRYERHETDVIPS